MAWQFVNDPPRLFCPLCRRYSRLVKISWMHHWNRCMYCLLKLPASKAVMSQLSVRGIAA